MKQNRNDHGAYVRKVQEGTQSFAQDVLGEIERLQLLVATLEAEMNRLHEQAISLRAENERHQKEQARLQVQLDSTRAESQRYSTRYTEIEQQSSNLANLYVASYRLHGTLDRQEVIDTIKEIIANLVGSEEAGLFELDPPRQVLELVASFGIQPDACPPVPLGSGLIGPAAKTGEIYVADPARPPAGPGLERRLTACIPLTRHRPVTR